MPAERSRGSRRSGADGNQLVWTMPVEPPSPSGISFTPNVTPITFNEPDVGPVETPESDLFPSATDPSSPRRPAHSKKKAENHIPRPPNAFILFRSSFIKSQHVSTEVETNHSTLSKIIGLTWQNLPEDERQVWHVKAKAALDDHKRKFPQYAFRPLHSKAKGGTEKRKVREVGPKDLKRCAKIAELLVEGKKGDELNAAVQEFDKHHVPEMVTRFEAPITEQTFQRSSPSAKREDTEETELSPLSSTVDQSVTSPESRSVSPGPPPLVEQDQIPQYMADRLASLHVQTPASPLTLPESGYSFSPQEESSCYHNTFSFNTTPSSPTAMSSIGRVVSEDSFSSDFGSIFDEARFSTADNRPSLSIDTSYPDPVFSVTGDWTRSSSPMSIPSTPCYPVSPMPGQYNSGFTSYPSHPLRHSSSSLSLESTASFESTSSFDSTSSFESTSSYEDFSNTYPKDYNSLDSSVTHSQYNQEIPIFINEATNFPAGAYESSFPVSISSELDDIDFAKTQVQYPYHQIVDPFLSALISPSLP